MNTITVQLPAVAPAGYEVRIGSSLLDTLGSMVHAVAPAPTCGLISDSNVAPLYLQKARGSLEAAGYRVIEHVFPAGEHHKNLQTVSAALDTLLSARVERSTPILALGGGVVGDLAGFVAATLLRGVPFVQIPTTLLAAVDASVGGKVGIDHAAGKNLIGAFHQPKLVVTDISTFRTLPQREVRSGLAECIKHAMIRDLQLFAFIADNIPKIMACDEPAFAELTARNVAIKAAVVQEDPFERGNRALLNFGHTFGHAIEIVRNFEITHGEAVALGMVAAARLAYHLGRCPLEDVRRLFTLLDYVGLPTTLPDLDVEKTLAAMRTDKKVAGGKLRLILPRKIGEAEVATDVSDEQIRQAIDGLRQPIIAEKRQE